ncbi:MAG TPA: DUF3795 domain-containing protein [Methanocella sp.]|nr:DUF3795 domain-containing protein [Methanocella sp.]
MASKEKILDSIAYCGLVCDLCHIANECDGCRNTANLCTSHSQHWGGCHHRNCCIEKKLDGCWECPVFPCDKDMFDTTVHGVKIRAYARCIREDGKERFISYIMKNEKNSIKFGFQKDYDFLRSEHVVLELLRKGKKV